MFRYLIITRNRVQFEIEEESGCSLYRMREFLTLLKDSYPEVVFTKFSGKPTRREFAQLDLVLVVPLNPSSSLLGQLIEGYATTLLNRCDATSRVRLAREEFKIELGGRRKRASSRDTILAHNFETRTKKLVAILRFDAIDPRWLRGTRAREPCKSRFGFFISTQESETYRGKRGTLHPARVQIDDAGNR